MALEMSTQGTINSLLSSTPSTVENNVANNAEDAANNSQMLPPLFASLLASQTNDASNGETNNATSLLTNASNSLDTSLLDGFASDEAISVMQNQLLGALQNNVFSALTASALTNASTNDSEIAVTSTVQASPIEEPSIMDSMLTTVFGDDGIGLQDGFDTLNIVNHLPIVSDIYEQTTSTHIAAASSLAGSFIYGGVSGLAYNAVDLTVEGITGKSISANLWDYGKQIINAEETSEIASDAAQIANRSIAPSAINSAYEFVRRSIMDE